MIRVLHVIGVMDRGGAETMIMNFYRQLDPEKYHFDFLVHEFRKGDYDDEIKELGGTIYSIPRYKIVNFYSYKKAVKLFFKDHHDYDIVHGHICSPINIYLQEAKKNGIVTIAHSHSSNFGMSLNTFYTNLVSRKTIKIADYFFGCSKQAGLDRYGRMISNSNHFFVINNGIDLKKYIFDPIKRKQLIGAYHLDGKKIYGHVGRFTKAKNHDFLIDVFYEIQNIDSDSVLLLFGRGELEEKIKNKVNELGLGEKVLFMGIVSNIYDFLNVFDVFIFPSLYEGLGIALVEAQANDLPCVVAESLPKEVFLSDKVHSMSLNLSSKEWALKCISLNQGSRNNTFSLLQEKGFDVESSLHKLLSCYDKFVQDKK